MTGLLQIEDTNCITADFFCFEHPLVWNLRPQPNVTYDDAQNIHIDYGGLVSCTITFDGQTATVERPGDHLPVPFELCYDWENPGSGFRGRGMARLAKLLRELLEPAAPGSPLVRAPLAGC